MLRSNHRSWILGALALAAGVVMGAASCGPPPGPGGSCRYDPRCGSGDLGAYCGDNGDCRSGHCCEKDQCDGGMCTIRCKGDPECPAGMLCQHDVCFFACQVHADCGPDQRCEHGRVCEW